MSIRTAICTLAGVAAVVCIVALTPTPSFSPQGIILPAQHVRAPIAVDQVRIYNEAPSVAFDRLGTISVEAHFKAVDSSAKEALFQKVKALAASVGANGVVINIFEPNNTEVGPVVSFLATAVYVPHQTGGAQ